MCWRDSLWFLIIIKMAGGFDFRATSTANLRLFPATSTTTVATSETTRRPSERETDAKKRASSAGGLYRNSSGEWGIWGLTIHCTPNTKHALVPLFL